MTDSKRCSKCGEVKALECFAVDRSLTAGRRASCKQCNNDYTKALRTDPEKKRRKAEVDMAWKSNHPESVKQSRRRHEEKEYVRRAQSERCKRRHERYRTTLSDVYLRMLLAQQMGVVYAATPLDLIEMKREQLSLLRLSRELNQAATNAKENP